MVIKNSQKDYNSVKKVLEKQSYSCVGKTSAVQVCRWTKNSLTGKGSCWKEKFYGVSSAGCCQMTPAVMWCENQCLHCWRPIEMNLGTKLPGIDDPKEILDGIVEARKKLMMGFKGNEKVSKKKFEKALVPSLYTMSLSGEATLYPRLGEMFEEIRRRKAISFLVTNGLNPEVLEELGRKNQLPTQITISTNAPNEKLFKIWHRSTKKDAWKKFNESLGVIKSLEGKCRRVVRLTLVKPGEGKLGKISNMEDEHVKQYVTLMKKAQPDFVHVKGYMSVGYARDRMGYDKQPWHKEVKQFTKKLVKELKSDGYKILAESKASNVVMIGKRRRDMKIRKKDY
jgi:tRNA wybutosine-synthesizing protein 1